MPARTRRMTALVAASALSIGLVACGGDDQREEVTGPAAATSTPSATATGATGLGETGMETVTAVDYAFEVDGSFTTGTSEVVLENDGEEPHEMVLMKLEEGRTVEDVLAAVEAEVEEPPSWVTMVGSAFAQPGQQSDPLLTELESGTYVLACFVSTEDGVPHAALGMLEEVAIS